ARGVEVDAAVVGVRELVGVEVVVVVDEAGVPILADRVPGDPREVLVDDVAVPGPREELEERDLPGRQPESLGCLVEPQLQLRLRGLLGGRLRRLRGGRLGEDERGAEGPGHTNQKNRPAEGSRKASRRHVPGWSKTGAGS